MLFTTATHRYGANDATGRCYSAPVPLVSLLLVVGLTALGPLGCSPSKPAPGSGVTNAPASTLQAPTQSTAPLARLHWLGKKRLAAEPNATNFMAIWNLPESARLEAQTLDKLATAPWRLLPGVAPLSNAPNALLRPLLDDLVQEECYLEVAGDTNRPTEFVLAVRLPDERAALWQTNLPVILTSLGPIGGEGRVRGQSASSNFTFQTSNLSLQLSRSGDWTLLSVLRAADLRPPAADMPLLAAFRSRILRDSVPFSARATNYWVEASADLRPFAPWLTILSAFRDRDSVARNLPEVLLTMLGEGGRVRTFVNAGFPAPIPVALEPWNIPTNLVHDPLIGFLAIRGFRPLLSQLSCWDTGKPASPPNQATFWVQSGSVPLHFFAFGGAGANLDACFSELTGLLTNKVNPMITKNSKLGFPYGQFELSGPRTVRWKGMPLISPFIQLIGESEPLCITGGLFPNRATNQPMPEPLVTQLHNRADLLLYQWETTHPVTYGWIQPAQVSRFLLGYPRFSMRNNAALPWLVAIAPKLLETGTSIRLERADRLVGSRLSSLGLSGVELNILADWLESPSFPCGLFSLNSERAIITAGE